MEDRIIGFKINSKGFGTIPKVAMIDKNLNIYAKALYAYFCSYTGGGDTCFPSRKKICYDLGISIDTFGKYLGQLVECGYIKVKQIKEKGRFSHNVYTLLDTISPCPKKSDTDGIVHGEMDTNNNSTNINSINNINSISKESIREKETVDYQGVIDVYNETCVSLPSVQKLTDKRKRALKSITKKFSVEDLKTVFKKAEESSFLNGSSDKWSGATFDWLIKEDNIVKVLEGNYDDKVSRRKASYDLDDYEKTANDIFMESIEKENSKRKGLFDIKARDVSNFE